MKLHAQDLRRPAGAIAVLATAAGLVLTGCGPSSGSGSNASGAKSPSSSGTSSSSSGSGGSSGGSTSVTSSASVPFPSTKGNTWKYKNTDGDTVVNKITKVTSVPAGQEVTMSTAIKSGIGGAVNDNTAYYILQPNGEISLPFSQFGSTSQSGVSVRLISGSIFWPSASALASGAANHSTLKLEYVVNGKKEKVTSHITVKGLGTQSVTVPAGTYSATVVQMTEAEKFDGYNIDVVIKTWLANGVGPVQSEVVSIDGSTTNVVSKEQLVSFHQG
jgi:hypothetical protein